MKRKITIHDLAKHLKLDSSTISRALSNDPRVKQKTKDLVLKSANELGYSRNHLASNLRKKKTYTLGVIVPHIGRFFFSTVIAGIEAQSSANRYKVLICQSGDKMEKEIEIVDILLANQVDGILMSIAMETNSYNHIIKIKNNQTPLVFFDRKCTAVEANNILIDDYQRSFEATEQLILNGCKRIAHFTGNQNVNIYQQRLKGYVEALAKHGHIVNKDYIFETALKKEDGTMLGKKILQMINRPDGILSANDFAAITAMKVFEEAGLNIPQDIAIIGFSNEPLSEYTNPPLTTIDQSPYEMGIMATETILNEVGFKQEEFKDIIIPSSIIFRKSSVKNS